VTDVGCFPSRNFDCYVNSLNNVGDVVGELAVGCGLAQGAWFYDGITKRLQNLSSLLSPNSPFRELRTATFIDDKRRIVGAGILKGEGYTDDNMHAFMMTL
jgi:hypothetical protein